jgi:hypothetical protein
MFKFLQDKFLQDKFNKELLPRGHLGKILRDGNFISYVLLPELGIRLIAEDLNINLEAAQKVMNDSVEYGVVMFRADS